MTELNDASSSESVREGKYARVERERRFLLADPPPAAAAPRRIIDRYVIGTRLRLRRVEHVGSGRWEFKLTQKVPAGRSGPVQGLITNMYLTRDEYDRLATLPAMELSKTRFSVPPLSVDVFDPPLHGLVLGEVEFTTDEAASSFLPPPGIIAEVTDDVRSTGGMLIRTQRHDLLKWLAEYGITPASSPPDAGLPT